MLDGDVETTEAGKQRTDPQRTVVPMGVAHEGSSGVEVPDPEIVIVLLVGLSLAQVHQTRSDSPTTGQPHLQ
ncbi:hypothetical protein [Aeromicrobium sp. PE09-221]|uniref:hypothetical protein n=1 Tax=Aeromicrobium sp. PE09-221 TaxID=1898043 RepID=UPI0014836D14|nr:hypothetical protein [Aeromicrobium sp. PE09-221]